MQSKRINEVPKTGRRNEGGNLPTDRQSPWSREWRLGLFLFVATIIAYQPAMHGGFVWDDDTHISKNETLHSLRGLWEIWFKPGATCQYYPLSFTGFWIGYQLWGLNPFGYHLLNVVLHSLVAVLLWQVLARMKVKGAWLAGAIFALHPVCVMSVAWMTELKNTLSAALALGASWAYLRFAGLGVYAVKNQANIQHPTSNAPKSASVKPAETLDASHLKMRANPIGARGLGIAWRFYALSLVLFQLALFAKTAVSFLPVSLLLVTWWRRERLQWRDVWPLVPMLGMAGAMGKLTFYIEHLHGASGEQFNLGFLDRVLVSGRSFWFYLGKLFFPHQLTFIYEHWQVDGRVAWQWLYSIATAVLLAGLWLGRRRIGKAPFAAIMHFFVCTSLLILLVVLYMTQYSFVSDHWQYFGCMSVIALVAAGITAGLDRFEKRRPFLKLALCGALLLVLGVLTWRQCATYVNAETLWRTTIARNPDCFMAHGNLGKLLFETNRLDEAIFQWQKALKIQPDNSDAHYNLGIALFQKERLDEAIAHFQAALEIRPNFAEAHNNLGIALIQKGQVNQAVVHWQKTIEIQPGNIDARNNLAWVLATCPEAALRNGGKAVELAQQANRLSGGKNPMMLKTLAAADAEVGRFSEAMAVARLALQLAVTQTDTDLVSDLQAQIAGYQADLPFRDTSQTNVPGQSNQP